MEQTAGGTKTGLQGLPVCDICGGEVARADGVLRMDLGKEGDKRQAITAWREAHAGLTLLAELLNMPGPQPWEWGHMNCLPDCWEYYITADRMDSMPKILGWTVHLADKSWFDAGMWAAVLSRFCEVDYAA